MPTTSRNVSAIDDNAIGETPDTECYDVIALQQGLLFNSRYDPGTGVDIIQVVIDWPEPLDDAALAAACQHATRRHPALRTAFVWRGDHRVAQRIEPEVTLPVERQDWRDTTTDGPPTDRLERFLAADRSRDFDPATAPLARVSLVQHAADRHTVLFSLHHAILDGRSIQLLLTEVFEEYAAIRRDGRFTPPDRRPFRDYVDWASRRSLDDDQRYWRARLADVTLPTPLPLRPATDLPPRGPESVREITASLDPTEGAALRYAAHTVGVPLSTLLNAAWSVLLHRYSGERDVLFGAVRACRQGTVDRADGTIGMMINTVPLRISVTPERTARDWLPSVRDQIIAVRNHQIAPLSTVARWADVPATTPIFESVLMYEHRDLQTALTATVADWTTRTARIRRQPGAAITICVFGEPVPRILLYHDQRRISNDAADRMLGHLTTCLRGIATGLDRPVDELPLLPAAELRRLTREWAGGRSTRSDADRSASDRCARADVDPAGTTIDERFADQVTRTPRAIALTGPEESLSYAELDARANRLAHLLVRHGVTTDTPVAVLLPRSVELVVTLLAVLKAGGAYLPIDPATPPTRVRSLLAPSRLALTSGDGVSLPPDCRTLRLDRIAEELAALPVGAPDRAARPDSLAYINHTSGSTGSPKAVAVPHRAVLRLVHEPGYLRLGPDETVLHLAPVAFDAATLELWGSLLNGARLVVAPPDPLGVPELARLLHTEKITVLWLTAGLFHQVVGWDPNCLSGVRHLLAGGDVLAPEAVRAALRARPGLPLVNGYGPTENTTFTCCHRMTDPDGVTDPVPIGRPVPRSTVYVLDDRLRPVPPGVPGELYTGGDGLARGYLGEPARTAERFVPNPFADVPGARMYRTGDRVRWRPDGSLEFLGRLDRQVKIRGFRVEPGEVEAVLRAHPLIGEVAVVVTGDGERRRLHAHLTAATTGVPPDLAELDRYATAHLPPPLRPAGYQVLAAMPLNRNGKIDRDALPTPGAPPPRPAPRTLTDPTQRRLATLWRELLGRDALHTDDDFFTLGGNSLLATRLAFLAADRFAIDLPIRAVYDHRGLAALAAEIDRRRDAPKAGPITARSRTAGDHHTRDRTAGDHHTRDRTAGDQHTRDRTAGDQHTRDRTDRNRPDGSGPRHLIRPTPGPWAMWRWVGVRAAGFPTTPLTRLGDPDHLSATDALLAAEDDLDRARRSLTDLLRQVRVAAPRAQRSRWNRADRQARRNEPPDRLPEVADEPTARALTAARQTFTAALGRLHADRLAFDRSHERASARRAAVLRAAAGDPLLREAVTWQNRHALRTGFDPLLAHTDSETGRDSRHRQHESLVATYLQRYCAKNDTIGFFGPVGWAEVTEPGRPPGDAPLRIRHGEAPLATRTVYFENWAVAALGDAIAEREPKLRPWLVPRRLPFIAVVGDELILPLTPPTTLRPTVARLLSACDGRRPAGEIAADLIADPTVEVNSPEQVYQLLTDLRNARRITWSLEVPKEDLFPERSVRQRLAAVPDAAIRQPALATLEELVRARDVVAAAAGDADRLGVALGALEQTFTELTGSAPTRRAGRVYAGRTLVYEDCRSGTDIRLSPALVGTLWPALSLLLESARWFTFAGAALFRRACAERYRELVERTGRPEVPFADFWLWANDLLFDLPEKLIAPVVRSLRERWARILPPLSGQRRIQVASATIAAAATAAFAAPRPGWVGAYQHSPDVMLAADGVTAVDRGDFHWVVGEVHPGVNTLRSALFMAQHPRPAELVAAAMADLPGPRVVLAATGEEGGAPARLTDKLVTDRDLRLVFGHDSCGLDPRTAVAVADCVLVDRAGVLTVHTRDGRHTLPLADVVGEALMLRLLQRFDILPPTDHQPRVTVDRVVIARESWRFEAAGLDFARTAIEADRFRQVRRWQIAAGLPRYVFVKSPVEQKPFFVDFSSLAAVDGFARAIRRAVDNVGAHATLRLSEMLPNPEQLWLIDPAGERHTAEFRLVAVDTRLPGGST